MNNYTIYTPICSIMHGFAYFERFLHILTLQGKYRGLEDFFRLMDQRSLQGKPKNSQYGQNVPNTANKDSATRSRKKKKTRKNKKRERRWGTATTTICPWWYARPWWPSLPCDFLVSSWLFVFHVIFRPFELRIFLFKRIAWLERKRLPSIHPSHFSFIFES